MRLVKREWGRSAIAKLNQVLPHSHWVSVTKRIDFVFWQTR